MNDKPREVHIDPREHMLDRVRPHAQYQAELRGRIVYAVTHGEVNLDTLQIYAQRVMPLVAEAVRQGPFGWISEYPDSMLIPAEAMDILAERVLAAARSGMFKGAAHVISGSTEGRHLMPVHIASKVFKPAGVPYRTFGDVESAERWLNELLDQAEQAEGTRITATPSGSREPGLVDTPEPRTYPREKTNDSAALASSAMNDKPAGFHIDQLEHLHDKLRPEGNYRAELRGRIVYAVILGAANEDALQIYAQRVMPLVAEAMRNGPFGWLSEYRDSILMPMDALDILAERVKAAASTGLFKGAAHVVTAATEGRHLIPPHLAKKVFGPAGVQYRVFEDVKSAERWLNELLDQADNASAG